jgi:heterodisulfide reductase subunit C/nitrate reductase gamma subunit
MLYSLSLYISLTIFFLGLLYKVSTWFRYSIGIEGSGISTSGRLLAAAHGIVTTLLSRKILTLFRVFILDVLLQARTFREDFYRWLMHMFIYGGFMLLLLMHALSKFTTAVLFSDYYSTLNPFLFLRDFGALAVILGLFLAMFRRHFRKGWRPATNAMDLYALLILAIIMTSGILLEGAKTVSPSAFQGMVQEYLTQPDEEEIRALSSYWVEEYGAVVPHLKGPFDSKTLEEGRKIHEINCMQCHSNPKWGFAGYAVSRIMKPVAEELDQAGLPSLLWHMHFLASFIGLALIPFSKMFHIFASPLSLMVNAVMDRSTSAPANIATKQIIELDACTHCGTCTLRCSVAVVFGEIPNVNILPSEKIASLKALASGRNLSSDQIQIIQQGLFLCTNCNRCTPVCPVGIELRDLWASTRERLLQKSLPESMLLSPLSLYRGLTRELIDQTQYRIPLDLTKKALTSCYSQTEERNPSLPHGLGEQALFSTLKASIQANSFSLCYGCTTCSNSCPVVRNYGKPGDVVGLMPHQLMHAIALRQWDMIFESMMLWYCLGCYQCQENCPQKVQIADILYELKNVAVSRIDKKSP